MIVPVLLIFAAVFLGTFAAFFAAGALRRSVQLKRRLRQMAAPSGGVQSETQSQGLLQDEPTAAEKLPARLPFASTVLKQLELSGVSLTPLALLLVNCALCIFGFCALFAWKRSLLLAALAALALGYIPFVFLDYRIKRRSALFAEQLPDALTMVARSLRAGHSLVSAVELIGQELPEPAGGLFRIAYEQQNLGMRIADSMRALRGKIESTDFDFFVTIVRINSESGGNLSEILDKLAETIRARQQIRRQVRVYTAEGRLSGYILVALPVAMFGMFQLLRPGYMDVFFTNRVCQIILGAAALAQVLGYLMIRKIVDIRI